MPYRPSPIGRTLEARVGSGMRARVPLQGEEVAVEDPFGLVDHVEVTEPRPAGPCMEAG